MGLCQAIPSTSDITVDEIYTSYDSHLEKTPVRLIEFKEASHDFGVGLMSGINPIDDNYPNVYRIEFKLNLSDKVPDNYMIKSVHNPNMIFYQHQFNDLSKAWRQMVKSNIFNRTRYTCIRTNSLSKSIYRFNHLDFLIGLINGLKMNQSDSISNIILFDRCKLCKVNLKGVLYISVWDIIKTIKQTLDDIMCVNIFEVIRSYCTPIWPLINIDNIQHVTREEYPMKNYTICNWLK